MEFERTPQMSVHDLKARVDSHDGLQILDVRSDDEWQQGRIPTATHRFLPYLEEHLDEFKKERPIATFCGSGYRASIAAGLLQRHGFKEVFNVPGSMKAWKAAGYETCKPRSQ